MLGDSYYLHTNSNEKLTMGKGRQAIFALWLTALLDQDKKNAAF
jgi:hypothetical protein